MSGWRETHRGVVFPWLCDQFGHLNIRFYAHFFDDASFHLWSILGMSLKTMQDRGYHTVVARTVTDVKAELNEGELIVVESAFVRLGNKSVTVRQRLKNADRDVVHAVQEQVEVFFDPETRRSAPVPEEVRRTVEANLVDPDSGL